MHGDRQGMEAAIRTRTALVTGAAGSIGSEIACALASSGCMLVVHDRTLEHLGNTAGRIARISREPICVASDLTNLSETRSALGSVVNDVDGIDILVNCAGIASDRRPIEELDDEYVQLQMSINVHAAIAITQLVIGGMKHHRWGRIINISSVNGTVGVANSSAYNAAKGALLALSKGWAREFGRWQITSNAVAPGLILTPMTESYGAGVLREKSDTTALGRPGTPSEVAAAVTFLASDGAGYLTGQVLSPKGGSAIV